MKKNRDFEEKLDFSCVWTLCGHCVAVPWPLKVQENEKKSTCGGSRRRAGPGPLGPQGPRAPWGPARLLELPQIDFFSFSWSFNGHGTATQCPHSVHTQEKSIFFEKSRVFLISTEFFSRVFSIFYQVFSGILEFRGDP